MAQMVEPYRELLIAAGANYNLWWLMDNNPTWLSTALPGLSDPARLGAAPGIIETPALALLLWAPLVLAAGCGAGQRVPGCRGFPVARAAGTGAATAGATPVVEPAQDRPTAGFWLRRGLRTFVLAALFGLLILALLMLSSLLLSVVLTPIFLLAPQAGGWRGQHGRPVAGLVRRGGLPHVVLCAGSHRQRRRWPVASHVAQLQRGLTQLLVDAGIGVAADVDPVGLWPDLAATGAG